MVGEWKFAVLIVAASAMVASASAAAQTAPTTFLPIPDIPPPYLFSPHPLAGTMLKPFSGPSHPQQQAAQAQPAPRAAEAEGCGG